MHLGKCELAHLLTRKKTPAEAGVLYPEKRIRILAAAGRHVLRVQTTGDSALPRARRIARKVDDLADDLGIALEGTSNLLTAGCGGRAGRTVRRRGIPAGRQGQGRDPRQARAAGVHAGGAEEGCRMRPQCEDPT